MKMMDKIATRFRTKKCTGINDGFVYIRSGYDGVFTTYTGRTDVICAMIAYILFDIESSNGYTAEDSITEIYKMIVKARGDANNDKTQEDV